MRRQVWDITEGEHAGRSIIVGSDGQPRMVWRLTDGQVADIIDTGGLKPRHRDAAQCPRRDLSRRQRPPLGRRHLRAI